MATDIPHDAEFLDEVYRALENQGTDFLIDCVAEIEEHTQRCKGKDEFGDDMLECSGTTNFYTDLYQAVRRDILESVRAGRYSRDTMLGIIIDFVEKDHTGTMMASSYQINGVWMQRQKTEVYLTPYGTLTITLVREEETCT